MEQLSYPALIPSQEIAKLGQDLNILVVAENGCAEEVHVEICIFGKADGEWKKMTFKTCVIPAQEHAHLYFTVPSKCLLPEFWDMGENKLEELELYVGHEKPDASVKGRLIFCER